MSFGLARGKRLETAGFGIEARDLPPFDVDDRAATLIDPRMWFDEPRRRLEIEIGSGKGTFLVQQAPLDANVNFLGIERAAEFYRYAADRVRRHGLTNVRMLHADAIEFLRFRCPDGVAAVVHVYFSDPWPKKRHHKRRVIQDETLAVLHRILQPRGEVRLITDHDDLWAWYETHAERNTRLFERAPFTSPESAGSEEIVGTNYERKFVEEGRTLRALTLVRREP